MYPSYAFNTKGLQAIQDQCHSIQEILIPVNTKSLSSPTGYVLFYAVQRSQNLLVMHTSEKAKVAHKASYMYIKVVNAYKDTSRGKKKEREVCDYRKGRVNVTANVTQQCSGHTPTEK